MNALALSLRKKCLGVRVAPSNTLGYPNHASWPDKLPRPGPILLESGQLNGIWTCIIGHGATLPASRPYPGSSLSPVRTTKRMRANVALPEAAESFPFPFPPPVPFFFALVFIACSLTCIARCRPGPGSFTSNLIRMSRGYCATRPHFLHLLIEAFEPVYRCS